VDTTLEWYLAAPAIAKNGPDRGLGRYISGCMSAHAEHVIRRFRLPRAQVGYVRMIVEAYDGLAVMVTPDAGDELIEWWIPASRLGEADALARALGVECGMMPAP
jgi:hypothetical protein